ncbi:hypothetical protein CBR_g3228 [Chara braunii]|uniref:Uncharacterized protein n=1 Tax=Chara braunii TaxID=69332 RepID=A0A388KFA1_CHABU|nr:hypothetical protein CBR_g3228 [Chara braunii]|eukprot:GBG68687.1 hypothetical protein CBR_g3228 [Chara braunii]
MASSSSPARGEADRRTNDFCEMLQHCFITGEENEAQAGQYIRTHRDENEDMVVVDLEPRAADMTVGYLKQHGVLVVFHGPGADTSFVKKEEWLRSMEVGWDLACAHDLHGRIKPEGANMISYLAPNHVLRDWLINTLQKRDNALVDGKQCSVQFRPWATPSEQVAIRQQAQDKFSWIRVLRVPFLAMPFLKSTVIKEFGQVLKDFPPEKNKATPRLVNRRWYGHETGSTECPKRGRQEGLSYAAVAGRAVDPTRAPAGPVPVGGSTPVGGNMGGGLLPQGNVLPQPPPAAPGPPPAAPGPLPAGASVGGNMGGGPLPQGNVPSQPPPAASGPSPVAPGPLPAGPSPAPDNPPPQPLAASLSQPQAAVPPLQPSAALPLPQGNDVDGAVVAVLHGDPNNDGGFTEAPPPTEQQSGREETMLPEIPSQLVQRRKGLTGGPRTQQPGPYDRPAENRRTSSDTANLQQSPGQIWPMRPWGRWHRCEGATTLRMSEMKRWSVKGRPNRPEHKFFRAPF